MGTVTLLLSGIVDDEILAARFGLMSIMILFLLGGYIFSKVDIAEGEAIAKNL
jgi:UMF1 family MFS transporter